MWYRAWWVWCRAWWVWCELYYVRGNTVCNRGMSESRKINTIQNNILYIYINNITPIGTTSLVKYRSLQSMPGRNNITLNGTTSLYLTTHKATTPCWSRKRYTSCWEGNSHSSTETSEQPSWTIGDCFWSVLHVELDMTPPPTPPLPPLTRQSPRPELLNSRPSVKYISSVLCMLCMLCWRLQNSSQNISFFLNKSILKDTS